MRTPSLLFMTVLLASTAGGPHLPLGNDLLNVRYAALHGAEQEYAVVFPEYYFGQIFEAKHEPGTVAYSRGLQLQLLQETFVLGLGVGFRLSDTFLRGLVLSGFTALVGG